MPYKCSVKGCRSNYDSTHEKVTVFSIPLDPELRDAWISNLMLTSTKKSARVCIKHFNPDDIENQNKRNSLKQGAVPTQEIHRHEATQWLDGRLLMQEVPLEEAIDEDLIGGFDDILGSIEEIQESLKTDWNVFSNNEGICFYKLAPKDEEFSDIAFSFKICVNRNMSVRIFQNDIESSCEEIGYTVLTTWSQLSDLLTKYQAEPPIEITRDPYVHLRKALGALELIANDEIAEDIDVIKIQIENLFRQAEAKENEELYQSVIEEDFIVEDNSMEDVTGEDYLDDADYRQAATDMYKCRYCLVQLISAKGLKAHEMKCNFSATSGGKSRAADESMISEELDESMEIYDDSKSPSGRKKRTYRYPCKECAAEGQEKLFVTKLQAAQHLLEKHDMQIRNVRNFCFICGAEFDDYINHVRVHSCKYNCSFCGSKFLTESKLEHHKKVKHDGENEGDRPFKCEEKGCGLFFKKVSHLKSHQQSHHIQMGSEEFKCDHCDKTFGRQLHLRVHSRLHNHSFECNYTDCPRVFKKLNSLKEHYLKEHGVVDIYMCNLEGCEERFQMLSQLKQHREANHTREPGQIAPMYFDGHDKILIVKDEMD